MKKSSLLVFAFLLATSSASAAVTITIQDVDPPGVGFKDNTPVSPVGGNNGTTLGQQRLIAFQFAASIWGATLNSNVPVVIRARWNNQLECTQTTAVLGSAGSVGVQADFPGAPFASTWYSTALANAISGTDQNGATAEITAQFNPDLGTTGCLQASPWYLGLDGNHGDGVDLVSVLLHEFGHGLGFQSFTDETNGQFFNGLISIFDKFLFDNTTNKSWEQMTPGERAASAINDGHLTWNGPRVTADVPNVLGTPRLRINSPPGIAGNYTVGTAEFGATLSSPGVTANVIRALDPADGAGLSTTDGCSSFTNAAQVAGNIAFIDRGTCLFVDKARNAQQAGAIGVIIGNVPSSTNPNIPPVMAGTDPALTIPVVSLALNDANTIRGQGDTVNGSIFLDHSVFAGADSSNRALIFAPNPVDPGSSVSHFDERAFPNQLMEPNNSDDLSHSVTAPQDLTTDLLRDLGWPSGAAPTPTIQLSQSTYSVSESAPNVTVTVNRSDGAGIASVQYTASDTDDFTVGCSNTSGTAAFARCDFATSLDTITFAAGETSKTFQIPIINDSFDENNETFTVTLSNATGATLATPSSATITIDDDDNGTGANPIFQTPFFVRQQYLDFLSREPEPAGFAAWVNVLNNCSDVNNNPTCDRITVSSSFFISQEFQVKGYFVYRFYKLAFNRLPTYLEIVTDMRAVTGSTPDEVFQKKAAFMNAFVLRPEFAMLAAMNNHDYVVTLMGRYSLGQITTPDPANPDGTNKVTLTAAELENRLNGVGGPLTRAQVLRAIADSDQVFNLEFNRAFVAMQYFGYLRRSPETAGYNAWLDYLTQHPGDFRTMVDGFMNSNEYRLRFGPVN